MLLHLQQKTHLSSVLTRLPFLCMYGLHGRPASCCAWAGRGVSSDANSARLGPAHASKTNCAIRQLKGVPYMYAERPSQSSYDIGKYVNSRVKQIAAQEKTRPRDQIDCQVDH